MKSFGERIKYLRSQAGLTLEEFGRLCRVGKSYISRLEKGERANPSRAFIDLCAAAFRIDPEWLAQGVGQHPEVVQATPRPVPEQYKKGPVVIQGYDPEKYASLDDPVHESEVDTARHGLRYINNRDVAELCKILFENLTEGGPPYRTRVIWAYAILELLSKQLQARPEPQEHLQIRQKEIQAAGAKYKWLIVVANFGSRAVHTTMVIDFLDASKKVTHQASIPVQLLPGSGNSFRGVIDRPALDMRVSWLLPARDWPDV